MNFLKKSQITPNLVGGQFAQRYQSLVSSTSAKMSPASIAVAESAPTHLGPFALGPPNPKIRPTTLDHVFLRWSGHFNAGDAIPKVLDGNIIHRARSYAAVRINLAFMVAVVALSIGMVASGKEAAARGESLQRQNLDWHKHINETHKVAEEAGFQY